MVSRWFSPGHSCATLKFYLAFLFIESYQINRTSRWSYEHWPIKRKNCFCFRRSTFCFFIETWNKKNTTVYRRRCIYKTNSDSNISLPRDKINEINQALLNTRTALHQTLKLIFSKNFTNHSVLLDISNDLKEMSWKIYLFKLSIQKWQVESSNRLSWKTTLRRKYSRSRSRAGFFIPAMGWRTMARLEFRFHEPWCHVQGRGRNVVVVPRCSANDDATLSGGRTFLGASRALSQLSHEVKSFRGARRRRRLARGCAWHLFTTQRATETRRRNGTQPKRGEERPCSRSFVSVAESARGKAATIARAVVVFSRRVSNAPPEWKFNFPAVLERNFLELVSRAGNETGDSRRVVDCLECLNGSRWVARIGSKIFPTDIFGLCNWFPRSVGCELMNYRFAAN